MTFKDYLISRKIDPSAFAKNEPRRYREFGLLFDQVHLKSFVMQKLFVLNSLRLDYPYTYVEDETGKDTPNQATKAGGAAAKPKAPLKPRPVRKPAAAASAAAAQGDQGEADTKPAARSKPRPVISPKGPNKTSNTSAEGKPKSTRPVIKPKIAPKKQPESGEQAAADNKSKTRPVIKPRPVIKKK